MVSATEETRQAPLTMDRNLSVEFDTVSVLNSALRLLSG
jgi:hypothetical protein